MTGRSAQEAQPAGVQGMFLEALFVGLFFGLGETGIG